MAIWDFLKSIPNGIIFMSSKIYDGFDTINVLVNTSTTLQMQDPEFDDLFTFRGTGLTYETGGGQPVVLGGTLTGMTVVFEGQTIASWTGINVSAATMFNLVQDNNWSALNALIFNSSDTYSLTDKDDSVKGFGGNDVMRGFGGNDRLLGDQGNDKLFGDAGADRLYGGTGNDTLISGADIDTLTGGAGADVFAFTHNGTTNRDIITDFSAADDALHFDNDAFTAFNYTGRLRIADFVTGTSATDAADRFVYQKSTGNLWYDRDGSGAAAKVLVAELVDGTTLATADIFIF